MPRNGLGVYSYPNDTEAVPNTTIESAKYNSRATDVLADLNAARPVAVGGTGATNAAAARTNLGALGSTELGPAIAVATTKATPVDADELGLADSAASNALKALSWANLKATLKTYLDTLYPPVARTISATGLATGGGTLAANRTITVLAASQAEAEAGTLDTVVMTPLKTTQLVTAIGLDDVGSYAFCKRISGAAVNPGGTIAGSSLTYVSADDDTIGTPTGTWMCMGFSADPAGSVSSITLWRKVSAA